MEHEVPGIVGVVPGLKAFSWEQYGQLSPLQCLS